MLLKRAAHAVGSDPSNDLIVHMFKAQGTKLRSLAGDTKNAVAGATAFGKQRKPRRVQSGRRRSPVSQKLVQEKQSPDTRTQTGSPSIVRKPVGARSASPPLGNRSREFFDAGSDHSVPPPRHPSVDKIVNISLGDVGGTKYRGPMGNDFAVHVGRRGGDLAIAFWGLRANTPEDKTRRTRGP